ncbi:MAG: amidase family protein [bacterium]
MRELLARTAHELLEEIGSGDLDHNALMETQLGFAREIDGKLNGFTAWADFQGEPGWELDLSPDRPQGLSRMPYAAKDLFATRGLATTAGSRILEGYAPDFDASVVGHLREARNHLVWQDQHGQNSRWAARANSAYGPTRNPGT